MLPVVSDNKQLVVAGTVEFGLEIGIAASGFGGAPLGAVQNSEGLGQARHHSLYSQLYSATKHSYKRNRYEKNSGLYDTDNVIYSISYI